MPLRDGDTEGRGEVHPEDARGPAHDLHRDVRGPVRCWQAPRRRGAGHRLLKTRAAPPTTSTARSDVLCAAGRLHDVVVPGIVSSKTGLTKENSERRRSGSMKGARLKSISRSTRYNFTVIVVNPCASISKVPFCRLAAKAAAAGGANAAAALPPPSAAAPAPPAASISANASSKAAKRSLHLRWGHKARSLAIRRAVSKLPSVLKKSKYAAM
mmetsp:Transcript_157825/g.506179  ORF Transcript_157825/g.506179 Transcript_157825/m.506179 type:complete len:213 (-) Transcript_157825:4953-5591(-)